MAAQISTRHTLATDEGSNWGELLTLALRLSVEAIVLAEDMADVSGLLTTAAA
jgi:hypothetical protein